MYAEMNRTGIFTSFAYATWLTSHPAVIPVPTDSELSLFFLSNMRLVLLSPIYGSWKFLNPQNIVSIMVLIINVVTLVSLLYSRGASSLALRSSALLVFQIT